MPAVAAFLLIAAATASYNLLPVRVQWNAPAEPVQAAPQPAPAATARRGGGEVTFESRPPGATVLVDGQNRGTAPLTLTNLSVGTHNVVFQAEGISINRAVRVRADQPLAVTQDMTAGFLSVFSRIPVDVRVDGRRLGNTDDGQLVVAPGSRAVVLENKRFNFRSEFTVEIQPSEVTAHTVMLPMGALVVTTEPGAEVFVEGERVGVAPLGPIAVPIGTREIMAKLQTGESRQSVEIIYGRQSEVTLALIPRPTVAPGTLPVQMPPLSAPASGPRR